MAPDFMGDPQSGSRQMKLGLISPICLEKTTVLILRCADV